MHRPTSLSSCSIPSRLIILWMLACPVRRYGVIFLNPRYNVEDSRNKSTRLSPCRIHELGLFFHRFDSIAPYRGHQFLFVNSMSASRSGVNFLSTFSLWKTGLGLPTNPFACLPVSSKLLLDQSAGTDADFRAEAGCTSIGAFFRPPLPFSNCCFFSFPLSRSHIKIIDWCLV